MFYMMENGVNYEVEEIFLDINEGIKKRTTDVKIKQGDRNSRMFLIQLYDGDTPFDITGMFARLYVEKPDKNVEFIDGTIVDAATGAIKYILTEQITNVAGKAKFEVYLTGANDSKLTACVFNVLIQEKINNESAVESSNEFSALINALDMVDNIDNRFSEHDTKIAILTDDLEQTNAQLSTKAHKTFVTYKEFGATLDGVTDDTEFVKKCHKYANENNLSVVQENSKIVITDTIEVKTNLNLSGSTVVAKIKDVDIGYRRTKSLFNIVQSSEDVTNLITQSELYEGARALSNTSLTGAIFIKTRDTYMNRRDGEPIAPCYKGEANFISDGRLRYPLTYDYTTSNGLNIVTKELMSDLIINAPIVEVSSDEKSGYETKMFSAFNVTRNNVIVDGLKVIEIGEPQTVAPIYTTVSSNMVDNITLKNIYCDKIGRVPKVDETSLGYLFLLDHTCNTCISNVIQNASGWSGVNGNYFRDTIINNSNVISIGGHFSTYDMTCNDTIINRSIEISGGGFLKLNNVTFTNVLENKCIVTKSDYAGEFKGTIIANDCNVENASSFIHLNQPIREHNIIPTMPDVEINNLKFKSVIDNNMIIRLGSSSELLYPAYLPKMIKINRSASATTKVNHTFKSIFTWNENTLKSDLTLVLNNVTIPRESYVSNVWYGEKMNIVTPNITNVNSFFNLNAFESVVNVGLSCSNNTTIKLNSCVLDVYRQITSGENPTHVGKKVYTEFINCDLSRPFCSLTSFDKNDFEVVLKGCKFTPFVKADGTTDTQIGYGIHDVVKYSSMNYTTANAVVGNSESSKIYNYIDTNFYKNN